MLHGQQNLSIICIPVCEICSRNTATLAVSFRSTGSVIYDMSKTSHFPHPQISYQRSSPLLHLLKKSKLVYLISSQNIRIHIHMPVFSQNLSDAATHITAYVTPGIHKVPVYKEGMLHNLSPQKSITKILFLLFLPRLRPRKNLTAVSSEFFKLSSQNTSAGTSSTHKIRNPPPPPPPPLLKYTLIINSRNMQVPSSRPAHIH